MAFVIGLGNPGVEYARTRHNVGFVAVEMLAKYLGARAWKEQSKFHGEVAEAKSHFFLKPTTYMNDSGRAARALLQFYDKSLVAASEMKSVWVLHDDLDIPLGSYKIQFGTGPKIHNGLGSLYRELGTKQFWHVRIGVDNRQGDRSLSGSGYVLQPFSQEEMSVLRETLDKIVTDLTTRLQVE